MAPLRRRKACKHLEITMPRAIHRARAPLPDTRFDQELSASERASNTRIGRRRGQKGEAQRIARRRERPHGRHEEHQRRGEAGRPYLELVEIVGLWRSRQRHADRRAGKGGLVQEVTLDGVEGHDETRQRDVFDQNAGHSSEKGRTCHLAEQARLRSNACMGPHGAEAIELRCDIVALRLTDGIADAVAERQDNAA